VFTLLTGATVAAEVAGIAFAGITGAAAAIAAPSPPIKRWWVASPKASHTASIVTRCRAGVSVPPAGLQKPRRLGRLSSESTLIGGCFSITHLTSGLLAGCIAADQYPKLFHTGLCEVIGHHAATEDEREGMNCGSNNAVPGIDEK